MNNAARPPSRLASEYGHKLLTMLAMPMPVFATADHPALAWRRAGLMAVTGLADGPGLICPTALTLAADGAIAALRALTASNDLPTAGASLLGERARLLGLCRKGATSPNGSCRLLATRDGTVALNLPRPDDWELLPALFGSNTSDWSQVAQHSASFETDTLVARGRLLGLAISANREMPAPFAPFALSQVVAPQPCDRPPLVVDLGSLWAAPLAGSLLRTCGAEVIKVESRTRPDSARNGNPAFFALLNSGKRSVVLDFSNRNDVMALQRLVRRADIVIEGSRPRALRQLGIQAALEAARGATWISITAHGRQGAAANWIGFGDDAAVAGGLSTKMHHAFGEPLFAGDAIADPLTGIIAALAGWASWRHGGGRIISVIMAQVVAHASGLAQAGTCLPGWQAMAEADKLPLYPLRTPAENLAVFGVDTSTIFSS